MGARIREHLRPLFTENSRIALDFIGVNVVSNSFADECIAKLLLDMPLEELNPNWSLENDSFFLMTDLGS